MIAKKKKRIACTRCQNTRGVIHKYNINLCRLCFKELAIKLGFKKLD